jgi:hypothetical protein
MSDAFVGLLLILLCLKLLPALLAQDHYTEGGFKLLTFKC